MVELYAIREKASGYFLLSKHRDFGSFEDAIQNGVYFNQRKSAEKRIRELMRYMSGACGAVCTTYRLHGLYFTGNKDVSVPHGEYRAIELEVVPLEVKIK